MAWKIVGAAMMAAGLLGCSVHSQAPVRQVAYDFSDHAYYDRDFAPSPNYADAQGYYGQAWMVPASYGHTHEACGCGHDHAGSVSSQHAEGAPQHREERRAARPRVDFDGDRDGSVATGRVDERAPDASDASRDGSRTRPRFTNARPEAPAVSEGAGRAEPAARPVSMRPEASRPAEASTRRAAPSRPMVAPAAERPATRGTAERRPAMKTADDRIAGR